MSRDLYEDSLVEDFGYSYEEVGNMSEGELRDTYREVNSEYNSLESYGWE